MNYQNPRQVYGETLLELGRKNENIVVLEADLGKSTMTVLFEQEFPERFFEMGIGEANMTSFAAGLSLTGKIAFTNSFAVFAAGRSFDQIRQGICIPGLNVKIIGSSAGLSDFGDGATHQSVEDTSIMCAIPNMTVLVPADGIETRKMTEKIAEYHGPVYMRINRHDLPDLFPEETEFEIGKPYQICEGSDFVVFANGIMVSKAMAAAEQLAKENISLRVVNVSSLKPIDEEEIKRMAHGMKGIVTAEEHSVIGGLASIISFILRGNGIPIMTVGINDRFGQSAHNYGELLEEYNLTSEAIVKAVKAV
ncbi:MAG TPA: transketolase C-terminal domain-containing protein [Bacteroidales bacterium]|nr:transketolase C-terminal domain-containing protein [Bacteroidales bacterium]HPI68692.1 transketolase C-terminal domain-containing protein [Bacteroidales bacterium]